MKKLAQYTTAIMLIITLLLTSSSQTIGVYNNAAEAYMWRLEEIYPTEKEWTADYNRAFMLVTNIKQFENHVATRYVNFQHVLYKQEALSRLIEKLNVYAMLSYHVDMTNEEAKERQSKMNYLLKEAVDDLSFIDSEIRNMDRDILSKFMSYPEMTVYKSYIEDVCDPIYDQLTRKEEDLLSLAVPLYQIPQSIYEAYTYRFPMEQEITSQDLYSMDRQIRHDAVEQFYHKRTQGIHVLGETLQAQVILQSFLAEANGYDSALALAMHKTDQEEEDYKRLIKRTRKRVKPLHHWMSKRQEYMGLTKDTQLQLADLHMPLYTSDVYNNISYLQGKELLLQALKPYGDDYLSVLKMAYDDHWIFPVPTQNKYMGAYTTNIYDVHPYVLTNYNGSLDSVLTLAHELGHAVNFQMSNEQQPFNKSRVSIYTAEITSTTNEVMVLEYLLSTVKTEQERLRLLQEYINLIINTVYNQVMAADFEQTIYDDYHAGKPINATYFNELWGKLQEYYYGKAFKADDISSTSWASIPHFYNSFYVYQYATGISAGLYFGTQISDGNTEIRDAYLRFLGSGASDTPLSLIKDAGVDMTDSAVYDAVFDKFDELIKEYDATYKKLKDQ